MGRIILLLIIAFLVYLVFRGFFKSATRKPKDSPPATTAQGEDMVTCARCGVNLPRSEATQEGETLICRDNPKCLEARK